MTVNPSRSTVGLRSFSGLNHGDDVAWQHCANIELFEVRAPSATPEEDMIAQAFQQAYVDACYRALVGQDALRSFGANEEFQIAIDARQPAKYQENQAFIREVVDRFYDDLLSVVMDVTDAEDTARFGPGDTIGSARARGDEGGGAGDLRGDAVNFAVGAAADGSEAATAASQSGVECKSLTSSETWLHYVVPVLGRIVVRNGFFLCFWHSTLGDRVGQLECRASRQVMEVNISHVHVPLCYHFRYKGRGVTAVSLIPIGDSLTDVTEQNAEVAAIAQQVASAFSLLPYESTGESDAVAVRTSLADNGNDAGPSCYRFLPRRVQAHFGRDGRYYLISNMHWSIPWLNSRQAGDHVLQRLSCVSPRLLARKGAHLSCRAFSTEAFIVENKSAMEFMKREIETGITQLLTDEREAAVRHLLSRQRQRSARRQERRLAEYKTRLSQMGGSTVSVSVGSSSASARRSRSTDTVDMIEMQTRPPLPRGARRGSSAPPHSSSSLNPLGSTQAGAASSTADTVSAVPLKAGGPPRGLEGLSTGTTPNTILSIWRELGSTMDDNASSQSSDDESDADSANSDDIFREQDRLLATVELLGAHPLEEDNTVNPFSSGSIVERFNRVGYPKSLLGVLLLSIMRFPSPPYHMVREVKREIMARGLKGYILEKTYDARFGVQQALSQLNVASVSTTDGDGFGSETSSVVEGTVVRPSALDGTGARSHAHKDSLIEDDTRRRKRLWSSEAYMDDNNEANLDESYRDPLLYSSREATDTVDNVDEPQAPRSRMGAFAHKLQSLGRTFLGRPTSPALSTAKDGSRGPPDHGTHAHTKSIPASQDTGSTLRHGDTRWSRSARTAAAPAAVVEAYAGVVNGTFDQDFGSIVERVLVAFLQYDGTELPQHGFARAVALHSGTSDAWAESEVLNTLYLESVLPYVYRKFRLEPHHVDLTTPLSAEDKMIVYQTVCESLGVCMRDGRAHSCLPITKDFRPPCKLVERSGGRYASSDPLSTQASIPIGDGVMGIRYTVPHWIRTRTDWLVRRLMLSSSATRQEWDLYGAALVPFLSIQRHRCLPSTKAALDALRSTSKRHAGRIGSRLPLPPLAVLGPMLLSQVHTMSTAPQLLWHAWAKDCYAFKEKDGGGMGLSTFPGHPPTHHRASPTTNNGLTLSLTSQGLDQCVEARREAMRSAGDRACLVHLLRRQAATYAVLGREIVRQMRDAALENRDLMLRLAHMQARASAASVSTMHSAIALADTLLEHLGNPYSFQYRRYSADLVRHMRARRDAIVTPPRFTPTTPDTPDPASLGSTSGHRRSPPQTQQATASDTKQGPDAGKPPHPARPNSPLAQSDSRNVQSQSGSYLLNDSGDNSLKLASDEEVALLHMLHQIQKYCSQDMLAALDHLQRGVLLFNVAYATQQATLDEERADEGLHSEDVVLNTHMTSDDSISDSLETAYRLLRVLDGEMGLYTLRALANLCLYYYAIGNFVNYQECLWSLRRSWSIQGPPDVRALVVAAPSDFAAVRMMLSEIRNKQSAAARHDGDGEDSPAGLGDCEEAAVADAETPLSQSQSHAWTQRHKLQPIHFRHAEFCD